MEKITFTKNGIKLDINFSKEENTIWMSQNDIAFLFKKSTKRISLIINEIDKELMSYGPTFSFYEIVAHDGKIRKVKHYNLDIIKQVGYKIDPFFTDSFVAWVNEELHKINNQIIPIQSNIIRFDNGTVSLDVTIEPMEQTVWLTQNQIALLFDTTQPNISMHIANIIKENELSISSVHKESLYTAIDGK